MEMGNCRERVWEARCLNSWFVDACHSSSTICCIQRLTHLNLKCMAKPKHDCVVYSLKARCNESWSCRSTTMVTWRHKKEIPQHYDKLNLILKIRRTVTWLKKVITTTSRNLSRLVQNILLCFWFVAMTSGPSNFIGLMSLFSQMSAMKLMKNKPQIGTCYEL